MPLDPQDVKTVEDLFVSMCDESYVTMVEDLLAEDKVEWILDPEIDGVGAVAAGGGIVNDDGVAVGAREEQTVGRCVDLRAGYRHDRGLVLQRGAGQIGQVFFGGQRHPTTGRDRQQ